MKDLKKQADDIGNLIDRMDEQVKQLTKASREELDQIEVSQLQMPDYQISSFTLLKSTIGYLPGIFVTKTNLNDFFHTLTYILRTPLCAQKAFVAERTELLETQRKKWEAMMQCRTDKEVEFMKARERRVEEYEQQLQHLRIQDAEEYNQVKIKLETDVQVIS